MVDILGVVVPSIVECEMRIKDSGIQGTSSILCYWHRCSEIIPQQLKSFWASRGFSIRGYGLCINGKHAKYEKQIDLFNKLVYGKQPVKILDDDEILERDLCDIYYYTTAQRIYAIASKIKNNELMNLVKNKVRECYNELNNFSNITKRV